MGNLLAIDTGGSKTVFNVYNYEYSLSESFKSLGAGLVNDSEEDIPYISDVLKEIALKYEITTVAVNLGGNNANQINKICKNHFPNAAITVFRESEGTAALELGMLYGTEIVLLAGTGTIATAFDGENGYVVSGGWGANIGDGGSGYAIGLNAIRAAINSLDAAKPLTLMQKEITGEEEPFRTKTNVKNICKMRDNVRARLQPLDRKNIASYTKIVGRFAKMGEADALELLREAGIELGKIIVNTAESLKPYKARGVTVTGGLLNLSEFWKESFEDFVRKNSTVDTFKYVKDGVILGTLQTAKKLNYKEK